MDLLLLLFWFRREGVTIATPLTASSMPLSRLSAYLLLYPVHLPLQPFSLLLANVATWRNGKNGHKKSAGGRAFLPSACRTRARTTVYFRRTRRRGNALRAGRTRIFLPALACLRHCNALHITRLPCAYARTARGCARAA